MLKKRYSFVLRLYHSIIASKLYALFCFTTLVASCQLAGQYCLP